MSAKATTTPKPDLNEVLKSIQSALSTVYKDSEGKPYCALGTSRLHNWVVAVESAIASEGATEELRAALLATRGQLSTLSGAVAAKDKRISNLQAAVQVAGAELTTFKKDHDVMIKDARAALATYKAEAEDAQKSLAATSAALVEAEKALKSPAAKFDPTTASELAEEVRGLMKDKEFAHNQYAQARAHTAAANKDLDKALKENAALETKVQNAKAELAIFRKQMAAAKASNVDAFTIDDIDMEKLELAFGKSGVEKLKLVLDTGAWDVRGRIQKLTGFFHVIAMKVAKKYSQFGDILKHALEILRNGSGAWVAILAPWVNDLLKDIVLLRVQPAKTYRLELQKRIEAVKCLPDSSSYSQKKAAAPPSSRPTWREVAADRVVRAKSLTTRVLGSCKRLAVRARDIAFLGYLVFKHGATQGAITTKVWVRKQCNRAKVVVVSAYNFVVNGIAPSKRRTSYKPPALDEEPEVMFENSILE